MDKQTGGRCDTRTVGQDSVRKEMGCQDPEGPQGHIPERGNPSRKGHRHTGGCNSMTLGKTVDTGRGRWVEMEGAAEPSGCSGQ